MGIVEAGRTCFANYATFSGRASRPEFWWFVLIYAVAMAIAAYVDIALFGETTVTTATTADGSGTAAELQISRRHGPIEMVVWLVFFLPLLAAAWRRMQDTGRPGATLLIPVLISLAAGAFLFLGVLGFGLLELVGLDGQFIRTFAVSLGAAGLTIAMALYIGMRILILWWLARPSQRGANAYGRKPAL